MTVLVSDSFNRANSTTTLGSTDSYNGGTAKTWQATIGTYGITNNTAYEVSGTADSSIAYVDAGASDVTVTATMSGTMTGLLALRINATNKSYISLQAKSTGYYCYWYSGSAWTTLASTSQKPVSGDVLKVTLNAGTLTFYVNGTQLFTNSNSALSNNQTQTLFGFSGQAATGNTFDNFEVDDLNTGSNASITGVIANATANAGTPAISQSGNVAITGVVASTSANGIAPSVSTVENISISTTTTNATASALTPNVGLSVSANIQGVAASSSANVNVPSVSTTKGVNIQSFVATANGSALIPVSTLQKSMVLTAVVANANVTVTSPLLNGVLIKSVVTLNASRQLTMQFNARQNRTINLKGLL